MDHNKRKSVFIDERPKATGNIVGLKTIHDPKQQINNPIAYLRGMKETMFSYVP